MSSTIALRPGVPTFPGWVAIGLFVPIKSTDVWVCIDGPHGDRYQIPRDANEIGELTAFPSLGGYSARVLQVWSLYRRVSDTLPSLHPYFSSPLPLP